MYVTLVLSPLILVALVRPPTDHSFLYTVGKNLALTGFTILAMQFVISARLKWIERPFGMNMLFHFHKAMAIVASLLLISHPVLLALGGPGWSLLFDPQVMWHIWLGRMALLIVLVHVLLASLRGIIKLTYETWRFAHNLGAALIRPLGLFHSWNAGRDFQSIWMKSLWAVLLFVALAGYLWHRIVRTLLLRRHPYKVINVREEAAGVWTIDLTPPEGICRFDYLPGQFHFLTFQRAPNLPRCPDELAGMERDGVAGLKVVHVLSEPSDEWKGERGRLEEDRIWRFLGPDAARRSHCLCAPPALLQQVIQTLRNAPVPAGRIHFERFSL